MGMHCGACNKIHEGNINRMTRKLRIRIYTVAIICLLSYFELGELRKVIYPNQFILIASLICGTYIFLSRAKLTHITKYELVWFLAIFFFILLRNRYLENGEFDINVVYYFLLAFLIVCMKSSTSWINCFIEFIYWISLIHAVATIVFAILPGSFNWYTSHFFAYDYYIEAMINYQRGTISGLCVNYGANAGILAMGTGIAVVKFIWSDEGTKQKRRLIPVIIRFAGLLFTGKRSPVLLMVVAITVIYIFIERGKTNRKFVKIAIVTMTAVMLVYIGAMFIPQLQVLIGRLMDSDDWSTLGGRTELYDIAVDMWKQNPLFGQGWNAYKLTSANSIGKVYAAHYARMQTHNIYFQLLSEVGIIGLIVFVGLLIYPLIAVFSKTRKFGLIGFLCNRTEDKKDLLSVIYMLMFFLLYGMTGNPLYDSYMYFLAFICCGALQSYLVAFKKGSMKGNLKWQT